ncbi:hypothetical protein B0A55_04167 [Friedmanniomyces simplex]|uniref:Uncharacterized protein n=1 Tax=Friedmanniomyces simplex TaxID=329884 RepID=A0A4U0XMH2_9PEZI|nr:hypothetical protein B0A55_04167 [Friedmanniomyces simplex]
MLPAARRNALYCQENSKNSQYLRSNFARFRRDHWQELRTVLAQADRAQIITLMQSDRHVLWNFANAATGRSGTVEFRGGRCLRGPVRTKRWIAFTAAILEMFLRLDIIGSGHLPSTPTVQALPDNPELDDDSGSSIFDVSTDVYRSLHALKTAWQGNAYNAADSNSKDSGTFDVGPAASIVADSVRNVLRKKRRQWRQQDTVEDY